MIVLEPLHPAPRLPVGAGHALQPGERLEEFEITRVLGLTSFGIVYLARSVADGRPMAVKEYLPAAIAARDGDGRVELRDAAHQDAFQRGLQSFIAEALTLSQFDHPHLLRVSCVWEGNGTAYRAMPHYGGTNLLVHRFASKRPPDQSMLRTLLAALAGALKVLHDAGLSHGQVEPMNIMMGDDGHATLLDFDAARHAILSDPHTPFVDACADPLHLRERQAADLQALAAVLHFAVSGQWADLQAGTAGRHEPLTTVVSRLGDAAADMAYDAHFLKAIDTALALKGDARPAHAQQLLALFDHGSQAGKPSHLEAANETYDTAHIDLPLDEPAASTAPAGAPVPPADPSSTPPALAHAQVVPQPRLKRVQAARSPPERPTHEYPLNSSESVLALLAGFGREQQDVDGAEPFQSPALPTLSEEAEPTRPPLRESLFDKIDAGHHSFDAEPGHGSQARHASASVSASRSGGHWRRIAVWGAALVMVVVGAIALRWN